MEQKNVKQGKKNRQAGKDFEKKVEKDLESKGWMVLKFNKQVEFEEVPKDLHTNLKIEAVPGYMRMETKGKLVTARGQFNPFYKRIVGEGSGFPDFLCIKPLMRETTMMLVEAKINGYLTPEERAKAQWINQNLGIKILIASEDKEIKNKINYKNFT